MEETKEADKTTGQAAHRISRGIHDKVWFELLMLFYLLYRLFGVTAQIFMFSFIHSVELYVYYVFNTFQNVAFK